MKIIFTTICLAIAGMAFSQANNKTALKQQASALAKGQIRSDVLRSGVLAGNSSAASDTIANRSGNTLSGLEKSVPATAYRVSTLAGGGMAGNSNGAGLQALLHSPVGVAVDAGGNVYVADAENNLIRKITPDGIVGTFAGNGTAGTASGIGKASFYYPVGVAVDRAGNVYVADKGNHQIKKITPAGFTTNLAGSGIRANRDGKGKNAAFDKPVSVAVDAAGNVYVADQCNHTIRKIQPDGTVSTLAGSGTPGNTDGQGATASFDNPTSVAVDAEGNVYVADYGNNCIRKITAGGLVSTLTGSNAVGSEDGVASTATFYFPNGVAVDGAGNVYIADQVNNKIRKLTPDGKVSTLAGSGTPGSTDGTSLSASFYNPAGVAVDAGGMVYVADYNNHKIRKIEPSIGSSCWHQ